MKNEFLKIKEGLVYEKYRTVTRFYQSQNVVYKKQGLFAKWRNEYR